MENRACQGQHCYCQRMWVGNVGHHQCCMCGHRMAAPSIGTTAGDGPGFALGGTAAPIAPFPIGHWVWRMAGDSRMIHLANQGQREADAGLLTSIEQIKAELGDSHARTA